MKSKIKLAFEKCKKEKRPALLSYTVAGDNTKKNSLRILNSISKHADILELGFPQQKSYPNLENQKYHPPQSFHNQIYF